IRESERNPILTRYLNTISGTKFLPVLSAYLVILLLLGFVSFWASEAGMFPKEAILKLVGTFCFLISTLVIPLISPILFPHFGESDPAFDSIPVSRGMIFDARLIATGILSGIAALPLLPLFTVFNPLMGRESNFYDIFPFLQATATAIWVQTLMEITCSQSRESNVLGRRLSVIALFVLLHILIVGWLSQIAWTLVQNIPIIKLVADINPFSQLYILMEGPTQKRLMVNSAFQNRIDYRLYLFIIHNVIFLSVLSVYRMRLKHTDDSL
ncbi:MAG: hypothetical protein ABIC40_02415, partial [bacterium]